MWWFAGGMVVAVLYGFHVIDKRIEGLQDRASQLEIDLLSVAIGDIPDKYHEAMERLREMRDRSPT